MKSEAKRLLPPRLWTALRLARINVSRFLFPKKIVTHRYGGSTLKVKIADPLGAAWYDNDWPPLPEIELIKTSRLKKGAKVFDLGCHQGVVAMMLAAVVGPEGLIVALDGSRENAALAETNRDLNGFRQIKVLHAVVGEEKGSVSFNKSFNGQVDDGTGAWGRESVSCLSVDDLSQQYGAPDVLFIDVEGYEYQALKGAAKTLLTGPACFVEVHAGCGLEKFGGTAEKILDFFPAAKYELYYGERDGESFRELRDFGRLPKSRFFLVALPRG